MKEIILENVGMIFIGVLMAIIGIVVEQTKSYSMIAGFNTMSAEKRKKVNIAQVAIALRNAFILIGLVWIIIPLIADASGFNHLKYWLTIGLHLLILVVLLILINTQSKFKIKT